MTPTHHPRIRVVNHGAGNWRTEAQDDLGEWAITGPPYPTKAEALVHVDDVARDWFEVRPERMAVTERDIALISEAATLYASDMPVNETSVHLLGVLLKVSAALAFTDQSVEIVRTGEPEFTLIDPAKIRTVLAGGERDAWRTTSKDLAADV